MFREHIHTYTVAAAKREKTKSWYESILHKANTASNSDISI